jgi:hypothetical protein
MCQECGKGGEWGADGEAAGFQDERRESSCVLLLRVFWMMSVAIILLFHLCANPAMAGDPDPNNLPEEEPGEEETDEEDEVDEANREPEPLWWSGEAARQREAMHRAKRAEQRAQRAAAGRPHQAANGFLYLEGTSLYFSNAVVVNAEVRLKPNFALSAGYGYALIFLPGIGGEQGFGPRIQGHFLGSSRAPQLEVAAGISSIWIPLVVYDLVDRDLSRWHTRPALGVYQRREILNGRGLLRLGWTWTHKDGFGPSVSLGVPL